MRFIAKLLEQYWLIISLAFLIIISFLSLSRLPQLPEAPGSDKTHHLIAYAALAFPAAFARPSYWWATLTFFLIWGGLIELIQPYVNRYGELLDFIANSAGVALGVLISIPFRYYLKSSTPD